MSGSIVVGVTGAVTRWVMILPDDGPRLWRLDPTVPYPVLERRADGARVYLDGVIGCMALSA